MQTQAMQTRADGPVPMSMSMSMCLRDAPAQWTDATRKNYYGKYSTRILLLFNLIINMAFLPVVFNNRYGEWSEAGQYGQAGEEGNLHFTRLENSMVSEAPRRRDARTVPPHRRSEPLTLPL